MTRWSCHRFAANAVLPQQTWVELGMSDKARRPMSQVTPLYPIASIRGDTTDRHAVQELYTFCSTENARVALIGFNECAKHLVNLCGDNIVGFYDPAAWKTGITFRGKPVVGTADKLNITHIAVCDILLIYDFADQVAALYGGAIRVFVPSRFGEKPTQLIDPFTQEQIYKDIFAQTGSAPLTMMSRDKLCFLMELLRYALRLPGDVIEVGAWQGGSAWYLAKVLSWMGETRSLFIIDLFETHRVSSSATMCNDEIQRALSFYPNVSMLVGTANDRALLSRLADRRYCFAHFDLLLQKESFEHLWERLAPGAPLVMDNYGHLGAGPCRFDRFFAERSARVIRTPWSEQGVVFRHAD